MSFLAAATQVKTVEVVKEVPVIVYQTPEWVTTVESILNQAVIVGDYAAPVIAGLLASKVHSVIKNRVPALQDDAYDWAHSAALFGYTFAISVAYLALKGQFLLATPEALASSFTLAFTGAAGRYAVLKAVSRPKATPAPQVAPAAPGEVTASFGGATNQF